MPLVPSARVDTYTADPRLLEDPHLCIVLGHTAVYKRALISDIELLMHQYVKVRNIFEKNAYDFQSFLKVWKELRFSIIHMGCTEKNGREGFMTCIYQILLSYLQGSYSRRIQNAAVFGLYMMYFTQPFSFPKVGIRLTLDQWKILKEYYNMACQAAATADHPPSEETDFSCDDVAYILFKLYNADAFLFVARDDPVGTVMPFDREDALETTEMKLLQLEREIMTRKMDPNPAILDELGKFDKMYYMSKLSLLETKASQQAIELVRDKLQRGDQLRTIANAGEGGLPAHRLTQSIDPTSLLSDQLGQQGEQQPGSIGDVHNAFSEVDPARGERTEAQQHHPALTESSNLMSTILDSDTLAVFSTTTPSDHSAAGNASASSNTSATTDQPAIPSLASTDVLSSTISEGREVRTSTTMSLPIDAQTFVESTTQPSRSTKKQKRSNDLFSPTKSDIASDVEDLMKSHVKTRWKRLDYAVQGKLDSFSKEEGR
ncbi:hypothetical protein BGW41_003402 [Actinomortierella wolfii]|nr:hypothetical protein BGW41_003402 [Actinomortierella wolfii]